eukprot:m.69780 g.69780  ORF g.69780 m.69780 type:complete len:87 (-) comp24140_c0_seq1:1549-1809(-)
MIESTNQQPSINHNQHPTTINNHTPIRIMRKGFQSPVKKGLTQDYRRECRLDLLWYRGVDGGDGVVAVASSENHQGRWGREMKRRG